MNAQGYWTLVVANYGGSTGTFNSWSLTIQPAGSPNALPTAGTAKVATDVPAAPAVASLLAATLSTPTDQVPFAAPATVAGAGLVPVPFSASVGVADSIPERTAFSKPVQSPHTVRPHVLDDSAFENFPGDEGS